MKWRFCVLFALLECVFGFDFSSVTSGISQGISSVGSGIYNVVKDNTLCRLKECCTKSEIPADFHALERELREKVYGQHLVIDTVLHALRAHWDSPHAQKPLTLSFHGWPGGGKNYVSKIITNNLFKKGSLSNHVHHFIGRNIFTLNERSTEYKENLYDWIKGNVSNCPYQLFIFDEVDKMPAEVLNYIKPLIDYREYLEQVNYKKSIFIFLSNTGSSLINSHYMKLWRNGVKREDIRLRDFESIIAKGAFNEDGGFHHSDTIKSNLIDHYVPFLPMQSEHVRKCIVYEFYIRGINFPQDEAIQEALSHIDWDPEPEKILSRTGCKRLSQKVAYIIQKNRRNNGHSEL